MATFYMLVIQIAIPEVRLDTFLAFLEYLYTDHSPIEDSDSIGILELANQYVMPRLTALCELYISKHVERATSESIAQADVDIIGRPHNHIVLVDHWTVLTRGVAGTVQ